MGVGCGGDGDEMSHHGIHPDGAGQAITSPSRYLVCLPQPHVVDKVAVMWSVTEPWSRSRHLPVDDLKTLPSCFSTSSSLWSPSHTPTRLSGTVRKRHLVLILPVPTC